MESSNKRGRDKYDNDSSYIDEEYENELKKLNMDTSFNSEEKSDNAASIETLLRNENILANDDDDDGEKTVSIKELDKIINEDSVDQDDENMKTPTKKPNPQPCLVDHPSISAKRIRFGNKGTVDYSESDPVSSLTPKLARIESNISTNATAFTELELPGSPETSRNSSYLAQFDNQPEVERVTRESRHSRQSIGKFEESSDSSIADMSLLSSIPDVNERRETADIDEFRRLCGINTSTQPGLTEILQSARSSTLTGDLAQEVLKDDQTARISQIHEVLDSSSISDVKNSHESSLAEDETVALQDLVQQSGLQQSNDDSRMEISQEDSDTTDLLDIDGLLAKQSYREPSMNRDSISSSRRTTMGMGEMKARLMSVLENYEQRMSLANETGTQTQTQTDQLSSQPLMHLIQSTHSPEKEESDDLDTTLQLQQYAEQLRAEMGSSPTSNPPSRRESVTMDLNDAMKSVFGNLKDVQQPNPQDTNKILSKMNRSFSNEGVLEADQIVTEDLKRLSELLAVAKEPEPSNKGQPMDEDSLLDAPCDNEDNKETTIHFSPLIAKSGSKQVIHTVKSNRKYTQSPQHQIHVIDTIVSHSLFKDDDSDSEPEPEPKPEPKPEPENPVETKQDNVLDISLNLDAYFLPKVNHSLLDDTSIKAGDPPLDSPEVSSENEVVPPSPIQTGFEQNSNISLPSPISKHSVVVEPNLSPIKVQSSVEEEEESVVPAEKPHELSPEMKERIECIQSFKEKMTGVLFELTRIQERKDEITLLRAKQMEIAQKKNEEKDRRREMLEGKDRLKQKEKELEEEQAKEVETPTVAVKEPVKKDDSVELFINNMIQLLGFSFKLISPNEYEIAVSENNKILARLIICILSKESLSIHVVLNPSLTMITKKKLDKLLPISGPKVFSMKDMTEAICRCIWILCHIN